MLRIVVVALLLTLPLSAGAQTFARTQTTVSGYKYQSLETSRTSLGSLPPVSEGSSADSKQCLTRKKTGKVECHSYAEWVAIARALAASRK